MKTFKIFTVALLVLVTVAFTACNSDDNSYKQLTKEEIAQCLLTVKGSYEGNLIYKSENKKNPKDMTDTVAVKWTITNDSTLTITKFPSKVLAFNVTDAELKKALEEAADQDMTCRIGFIKTSPVTFLVNPVTPSFDLTYGGKKHKVQVAFAVNNFSSYGVYNATKKVLGMQIVEGLIGVDGTRTNYLKQVVPFVLQSTKKI